MKQSNMLLLLCSVFIQLCVVYSDTWVSTRFVEYANAGKLENGDCCVPTGNTCQSNCIYEFTFCINDDTVDPTCTGTHSTTFSMQGDIGNVDFGDEPVINGAQQNPQGFKIGEWEGSIPVKMVVKHQVSGDVFEVVDVLVGEITNPVNVDRDSAAYTELVLTGERTTEPTTLTLSVATYCNTNYYGDRCATFCVSSDSCNGHFECSPADGSMVCMDGWTGDSCNERSDPSTECRLVGPDYLGTFVGPMETSDNCGRIMPISFVLDTYMSGDDIFGNFTYIDGNENPMVNEEFSVVVVIVGPTWFVSDEDNQIALTGTYDEVTREFSGTNLGGEFGNPACRFQSFTLTRYSTPDDVGEILCMNGGACITFDDTDTCCCADGYEGERCEELSDPCLAEPCDNEGVCSVISNIEFDCDCAPGYYGMTCQIFANNITCADEPCLNDGTCQDTVADAGYNCTCPAAFGGDQCEIELEVPCAEGFYGPDCVFCVPQDLCSGHYDCNENGTKICLDNWEGEDCTVKTIARDVRDPECQLGLSADSACGQRGSCFDGACCCDDPAFDGNNACSDLNECNSDPCQNDGECFNQHGFYECDCTDDYFGYNCELTNLTTIEPPEPTEPITTMAPTIPAVEDTTMYVSPEPCVPADDCSGHYTCGAENEKICNDGWSGDDCNTSPIPLDQNDPEHCEHELDAGTICYGIGYCWEQSCCCFEPDVFNNDDRCEQIDECLSNPCQNGGTCIDGLGGYTCLCPEDYEGENCEETNMTTIAVTEEPTVPVTAEDAEESTEELSTESITTIITDISTDATTGATTDGMTSGMTTGITTEMTTEMTTDVSEEMDITDATTESMSTAATSEGISAEPSEAVTVLPTTEEPCVPIDDCTGHYDCDANNQPVCLDGYSGDDCNTKDLGLADIDPDCNGNGALSAMQACSGRGYCFNGECCCEDSQFDNSDQCGDFDECASNPCQNGGECRNQAGSYECDCPSGTEGTDCEIEIITTPAPFCEPTNDCDGHYDCTDAGEIVCLAGWQNEDNDCKDPITPVTDCIGADQCINGGTCLPDIPMCCCPEGFEGERCGDLIDECLSDPCNNGGTCTDYHLFYLCDCPPGTIGDNCDSTTLAVTEPTEQSETDSTEMGLTEPTEATEASEALFTGTTEMGVTEATELSEAQYTGSTEIGLTEPTEATEAAESSEAPFTGTTDAATEVLDTSATDGTSCPPGTIGENCATATTDSTVTEVSETVGPSESVEPSESVGPSESMGTTEMMTAGTLPSEGSAGTTEAVTEMSEGTEGSTEAITESSEGTEGTTESATEGSEGTAGSTEAVTESSEGTEGTTEAVTADSTALVTEEASEGTESVTTEMSTVSDLDASTIPPELIELARIILSLFLPDDASSEQAEASLAALLQQLQLGGARRRKRDVGTPYTPPPELGYTCEEVIDAIQVVLDVVTDPVTGEDQTLATLKVDPVLLARAVQLGLDLSAIALGCINDQVDEPLEPLPDDTTQLLLTSTTYYSFRLVGIHSDAAQLDDFKAGIQTLYSTTYPDLVDCIAHIPKHIELIGENGEKASLIKFWIEKDGVIIDPVDYAPIATAEVVAAVNVEIVDRFGEEMAVIEYSETSRVYDYQNTHFIMITGQVYEEDLPHFKLSLDAFFEGSDNYTVEMVPRIDSFFETTTNTLVSKVLYELYTFTNVQVLPTHVNVAIPTETELTPFINFVGVMGTSYTLDLDLRTTITIGDHKTASSSSAVRLDECMSLVVEGSFVQSNIAAFKTVIESSITTTITTSTRTFEVSNVIMAGTREIIVGGVASTAVLFALETDAFVLDARMVDSFTLSTEDFVANVEAQLVTNPITRPDGSTFTFISDSSAIMASTVRAECLVFYAEGSVTAQQSAELNVQLKSAVLQAQPDLVEFEDSLEIDVLLNEEFVAMEVGSSTGVYYSVSFQSTAGMRVTVNAQQSATFDVSAEILAENLVSEEGTSMFNFVNVETTTVYRRSQLMFISVQSSILPSDYAAFETSIQQIVDEKLVAESVTESSVITTAIQQVSRSVTGEAVFQLGFAMETTTGVTVTTETVSAVTTDNLATIQVESQAGGTYSVETDVSVEVLREETLFALALTTPISSNLEIEQSILATWQESEAALFESSTEASVTIISVVEQITVEGESVFNVQYSLNIDSVQVSATVQSSVSIEAIATNLATVTNAQGIAYEVNVDVSISLSMSTSTTQLMTTEFAWPIVMATAVSVMDVQQFTEVTQNFVNSMVTVDSSLEVVILRQREIVVGTEIQWSVDLSVTMNGQAIQQTVVPEIDTTILSTQLTAISESYVVTSVSVSAAVDLSATFTQTFSSLVVSSDTSAIINIIQEQYRTDVSLTNVQVTLIRTEEIINVETSESLFNIQYIVSQEVNGETVIMDARVDSVVTATAMNVALESATLNGGATGAYVALEVTRSSSSEVSISASSLVRREQCLSITVEGEIGHADMAVFARVMETTVTSQFTANNVADMNFEFVAVQQQQLFSVDASVTATSSVSTAIIIQATSSVGTVISPSMIGEIDATILQTSIATHSAEFVSEVEFTAITSTTVLQSFVSLEDTVSFTFDAPVTALALVELEASIAAQLNLRGEFSSDVIVTAVNRQEIVSIASTTSFEASTSFSVDFAIQTSVAVVGESSVISATSITALTAAELDVCLDVAISAESEITFAQSLVATADASIDVAVEFDLSTAVSVAELHSITLNAPLAPSQRDDIQATMAASILLQTGVEVAVQIASVRSSFDIETGLEVFEVQFATTALQASASVEVGAVLSTADLTTISVDEITTSFATGGIQTVQNEAFVAIDTSSSVVVQAESMFVSTHTQIIQESEVNKVEIAFAAAFRATMETSLEITSDTVVEATFVGNREIITEFGTSIFEAQFALKVDGVLVDSRETGEIDTTVLATELAAITVTGTTVDMSQTVIAETNIDVAAAVEYEALVAIHTETEIDISVQAEMEVAMEITMAAELGIEVSEVDITIASSETVVVNGETVARTMMAVEVGGVALDARALPAIDAEFMAALDVNVQANVELAAEVTLRADVTVDAALRLDQAVDFFFANEEITVEDAAEITAVITAAFQAELGLDVDVSLGLTETFFSSEGNAGTSLSIFVERDGEVIQQSLSATAMTALTANLAALTTASGQAVGLVIPAPGVIMMSSSSTFGFFMSVKLQSSEFVIIQQALAAEWNVQYEGISVQIFTQEVFFSVTGERVFRVAFSASVSSNVLSSTVSVAMTHAQIQAAFSTVAATTVIDYSSFVLDIDGTTLLRRADLGFLVFSETIVTAAYTDIAFVIKQQWNLQFSQEVNIEIFAQEQVVIEVGATFQTATQLFYQITLVSDSSIVVAQNFHAEFHLALTTQFSSNFVAGIHYTVINTVDIEVLSMTSLFSVYMTQPVLEVDFADVTSAFAVQISASATSTIRIQQEVVIFEASTQVTSWQVMFAVSEGTTIIDAEQHAITTLMIQNAFTSITISQSSETYFAISVSVERITAATVVQMSQMFTVLLSAEITVDLHGTLETELMTLWRVEESSVTAITIIESREVILSTGEFAFELIYLVMADTTVISSQTTQAISVNSITTVIQTLTSNRVTVVEVEGIVRSVSNSMSVTVSTMVAQADFHLFVTALQTVYTEQTVVIATQDIFIFEGKFISQVVFFLEVESIEVNIQTISVATFAEIEAALTFELTSGASFFVLTVEQFALTVRSSSTFTFALSTSIITDDLVQIQSNLLEQWAAVVTEAESVVIVIQETAVTFEGESVFNVRYTVESSSISITSSTHSTLEQSSVTAALQVTMSSSAETYATMLIAQDIALFSTSSLFTVRLQQRLAIVQYEEFSTQLTAIWNDHTNIAGVSITVMTQEQQVSLIGEFSWSVLYKVESVSESTVVLDSRNAAGVSLEVLIAGIDLTSPLNVAYTVIDSNIIGFVSEAAFSIFLNAPVLQVDVDLLKTELDSIWTTHTSEDTIEINTIFTNELIDVNGVAVYSFNYFVQSSAQTSTVRIDARFDTSVSVESALTAVTIAGTEQTYSDVQFTGDVTTIIQFSQLIQIAMSTKVAVSNFVEITTIAQTTWTTADTTGLTVTIRSQEDFVTEQGAFIAVVLFSAEIDGTVVSIEDLPALEPLDLGAVISPSGEAYSVLDIAIGSLRRYRMTMSVHFTSWVTRTDMDAVMEAVRLTIVEGATVEVQEMTTVAFGSQEELAFESTFTYKLSFFVLHGTTIVDGQTEAVIDADALQTQLTAQSITTLTVVAAVDVAQAFNLRMSYKVLVSGTVPADDLVTFTTELQALYTASAEFGADFTVESPGLSVEVIGEFGAAVTEVLYLLVKDGQVQDPEIVIALPTADLSVTATSGATFEVYTGTTIRYDQQYSFLLDGVVDQSTSALVLTEVQTVWANIMTGSTVEVSLSKLELNFGEFGTSVTKIMYSVDVDGLLTFPANDPSPPETDIVTAINAVSSVQVSTQSVDILTRADQMFDVTIQGELNAAILVDVEIALTTAWQSQLNGATLKVTGSSSFTLTTEVTEVQRIFYSITMNAGAETEALVSAAEVTAPSVTDITAVFTSTQLSQTLTILDTTDVELLTVHEKTFTGAILGELVTTLRANLATAWANAAPGKTAEVIFVEEVKQFTATMSVVTTVRYTVSLDGADSGMMPDITPPSDEAIEEITGAEIAPCGCTSLEARTMYLADPVEDILARLEIIKTTIKATYVALNEEMNADQFDVTIRVAGARKRRATEGETPVDEDGNALTATDFTVGVGGTDPNELFVTVPEDSELASALEQAGFSPVDNPALCTFKILNAKLTDTTAQRTELESDLTDAYILANPAITAEDINIEISSMENMDDEDDNEVTKVSYCVTRNDGGDVSDLLPPSNDHLNEALDPITIGDSAGNFTPVSGDGNNDDIIIIIAVICGVIAVIIVILVIIKVCLRNSHIENEKQAQTHEIRHHPDDDDFTSHAPYNNAVFRTSEVDTLKTKLYEARANPYP